MAQSVAASGRPSTGSNRAARWRSRSSASSTAASSTAAAGLRSAIPRYSPGIERRHRVEGGREGQRRSRLDHDVADVGRVDRLEVALAQALVERLRHQVVGHVVQDIVLEPLPDDARRHFARAEARDLRRPAQPAR